MSEQKLWFVRYEIPLKGGMQMYAIIDGDTARSALQSFREEKATRFGILESDIDVLSMNLV
ncbi:hypothetical protein [Pantoea agglomerans]|uniref:hypothetical protein n=1 Tax=Enterobacter agglomerans TaxID=549 RepID=UPI001ABBD5FB|nr:hypothetical protein [Pantoea agglomerans]